MPKLAIIGTIEVAPGRRDQLLPLLMAHRPRCLKDEPGTLQFEVLAPREDDTKAALCTRWLPGFAPAMRSVLALGLLIGLCASANAARVHHSKPRHVIVHPSQGVDPRFPPVLQDQTPSYDDPSKRGGA
jgi:hypothetical protein